MDHFLNALIKLEVDRYTRRVKFLDVHLHLALEVSGEVGPPEIVSSMEWWAIYREWRSFTRIQPSPTQLHHVDLPLCAGGRRLYQARSP